MKQSYSLILIILASGITQIHCKSGVVRDKWQDAADELVNLTATATKLVIITVLQVERTSSFLSKISLEASLIGKDEVSSKIDLALLDIKEWKELTISFGLEPPSECVTDQEAALRELNTTYVNSIDESCGEKGIILPVVDISIFLFTINSLKDRIDDLKDQFYACGQDATCLDLLYPEISSAGQYNDEIRSLIFAIEEIVGNFPEIIDTQCVRSLLDVMKESITTVLVDSKGCLRNSIIALG